MAVWQSVLVAVVCNACATDPQEIRADAMPREQFHKRIVRQVDPPAHVYIVAGQSNATGRGDPDALPADYKLDYPAVQLAAQIDCDDTYPDPCTSEATEWGDLAPRLTQHGVELSFGRALQARGGRDVYILQCGTGGTGMVSWEPDRVVGARLYQRMFEFLAARQAELRPINSVRALIWIQGEADAKNVNHAAWYESRLTEFIAAVRADIRDALPVVLTQLHAEADYPYCDVVRAAQVAIAADDDLVTLINNDDLTLTDGAHYDSASYVTMGERIAAALP